MKSKSLHIAQDLRLPIEAVTETFGILAKRSKGKTYAASVIAEEMLEHGQQICVVDPLGVWWGLRAGADGTKKGGLPVVILGGKHADLPLEAEMGHVVARLVTERGLSLVLDLSQMSKSAMRRFFTDFAEELYQRNETPLHIFVDEADIFAPQRLPSGDERMFGAIDAWVRRGRAKGLGVTLISQRPAVVNKDVLSQIEVLIAMGMTSPQDRKAIKTWVEQNGDEEKLKQLDKDLAKLGVGDAWIWSEGWLGIFQRIHIRERRTFDSSATPKVGHEPKQAKELRDVDLAELRAQLADVVERQAAADPARLQARVRELEKQLHAAPHLAGSAARDADVERAVAAATRDLQHQVRELHAAIAKREKEISAWHARLKSRVEKDLDALDAASERVTIAIADAPPALGISIEPPAVKIASPTPAHAPAPREIATTAGVSGPQQRILNALAEHEVLGFATTPKVRLAFYAEASPTSSAYANNLGALRTAGFINYPAGGMVALTDAGRKVASATAAPASHAELIARTKARLSGPQQRILDALVDAFPSAIAKEKLAELADASATSSAFANNLGAMRTIGVLDYPGPGQVRIENWLMEGS